MHTCFCASLFLTAICLKFVQGGGLTLTNPHKLQQARDTFFGRVFNSTGWVVLNYVEEDKVEVRKIGEETINLIPHLEDNQVQYALLRVQNGKGQEKDIFIHWIGPNYKGAPKIHLQNDAEELLKPFTKPVKVSSRENINNNYLWNA